jgi:response regulator RpfG family c-di-GMP phosphodiesterase
MHPTGNPRILERLAQERLITREQREAVANQQRIVGGRYEEALLDCNALQESALLKFLAGELRTRFVATEKLAKADIPIPTLNLIPRKMAEQETVFPVLFNEKDGVLTVVTPDPDNQEMLRQVQLQSTPKGVKQVQALIARPLAVRAAIAKHYAGDIHAFALLDRTAHEQFTNMLNVFERNLVSEESMAVALAGEPRKERMLSQEELEDNSGSRATSNAGFASDSYLETLNVLVSLLENERAELRGHSAFVARLVKKIAERIGLGEAQTAHFQIAAYLHDLGKMGSFHLTPYNVAEYEGHRQHAVRLQRSPVRLIETMHVPEEARLAIEFMYERFDGKGIPGEHRGKEIPLGARLLAIADTYADLTQNAKNPYRKILKPAQACEVLSRAGGKVFDPNLTDLFKHAMSGEDLKARLLSNRHVALLIEPDPEESTVIELRMIEQGFEVRTARTVEGALKTIDTGDVSVVVSEVDLGKYDGFGLLTEARKRPGGEKVPWVFVTARTGRADAQRAFELGASDYMTKPIAADVLVAKLKQVIEREARGTGARGVAGSLQEMGLPEIVQVLYHGRKTGSLKIRSGHNQGEIHFVEGAVYNALWGNLRGAEAFYGMVTLTQGDFLLDPNFQATHQVIHESAEALLLEGMRRMDEGTNPSH